MRKIHWYLADLDGDLDTALQEADERNYVANCIYDYALALQRKSCEWQCAIIDSDVLMPYIKRKWNRDAWLKQAPEVIHAIFERAKYIATLLKNGHTEIVFGE